MMRPPPPCLIICCSGQLGAKESALEIDRHHLFILRFRRVKNGRPRFDARIIDHYVHAPEFLHGGGEQIPQFSATWLTSAFTLMTPSPKARTFFSRASVASGWATVINDDAGALPGQLQHDRLTDAAVAAGDDGGFAFKTAHGS